MAKAIDYIQDCHGKDVLLTTSSDITEISMVDEISGLCKHKPLRLPQQTSLQEYAYLVSKATLFFGIDSAPMHIAASTDTPVIALFGASKPDAWGPWHNKQGSNYTRKTGVQYNGFHTVISNSNLQIELQNGEKLSQGMMSIELDLVINELKRSLSMLDLHG